MVDDDWLDLNSTKYRTILDLRNRVDGDLVAFGHYNYDHAMPPIPKQSSATRLVFGFLISGLQRYRIDGEDLILRGGQGIRLMPGSVYSSADLPEQRGEFYWLVIKVPQGGELILPGFSQEAASTWWQRMIDPDLSSRFPLSSEVRRRLLRLIQTETKSSEPMLLTSLALDCGTLLVSLFKLLGEPLGEHTSPGILQALQHIESHLSDMNLDTDALAQAAQLSPSRFHTRFKDETGLPPADYLRHRRVIEAQRLLASSTSPSVTEVAMRLGFSSSQYFATVFKRYTRMSPSRWQLRRYAAAQSHKISED